MDLELRPSWLDDLENLGWERLLLDRMNFHGALYVDDVSNYTGISKRTVKKHFLRLVYEGKARAEDGFLSLAIRPPRVVSDG